MLRNLVTRLMWMMLLFAVVGATAPAQTAPVGGGGTVVTNVAADSGANGKTLGGPEALLYDGKVLWVANQFTNSVSQLSTGNGTVQATYTVGSGPVALASDGKSLWIANLHDSTVVKLNPANGSIAAKFNVPGGPGGLAWDGTNMWVACRENDTVVKLSGTGLVLTTVTVGRRPVGIAYDRASASVWVANNQANTVTKIDAATGSVLGTFAAGRGPFGVLSAFGSIFVSNFFDGTLTKLSPDGLTSTSITVGDGTAGMTSDATTLWVTSDGVNTLTRVNPSTGAAVARFTTGRGPFAVVLDGTGNFWTANFSGGTLTTSTSKTQLSSAAIVQ